MIHRACVAAREYRPQQFLAGKKLIWNGKNMQCGRKEGDGTATATATTE